MQDHIFRMYDVRGIVGTELDITQVYDCARAFAVYARTVVPHIATVAVGMDGRVHSPAIKDEFVRGLQESGLDVIFVGVCPTPVISFSEYWLPVQAACMITASHNPKEYNGIKFFLNKKPVCADALQTVHALFKKRSSLSFLKKGECRNYPLIPDYVAFLTRLFPHVVGLTQKIVFDCGNGATGAVLPALCNAFGWTNAVILYSEVDGTYPHHEADPSVEENMHDLKRAVRKEQAIVGIGFDGDGDRMGAVSESGAMVAGDALLGFLSTPVFKQFPGCMLVCDAKSSTGLHEWVCTLGGNFFISPSGHAFLRKAMLEQQALVGGELSCHFFFKDRYFGYDDGIYAALRLIELLVRSKGTVEQFLQQFPFRISSPEIRIACGQGEGLALVASVIETVKGIAGLELSTVDGVSIKMKEGWGVLRASNTQPVVSLRIEALSENDLRTVQQFFIHLLENWYTKEFLETAICW